MKTVVEIKFDALRVPGGADAILGPSQCTEEVVEVTHYKALGRTDITVVLGEHDERVSKLMALLAAVDEKPFVIHTDIYTEDERQTAPLLILQPWGHVRAWGGPRLGTSYDIAQACQRCGTGARQTSDMIIANDDVRRIEKLRIAATTFENVLLNDDDVDRLITAQVSGALFWPVHAKTKAGTIKELRRQQVCVEHVLPPMAPSSHLDRTQVCPSCRRGCFTHVAFHPLRLVYRRQDLANIQDINLTWEWFGDYAGSPEEALAGRWPDPLILITPKVMNLLRGKTKKEQKSQGCDFIPIWIEDDTHDKPYLLT